MATKEPSRFRITSWPSAVLPEPPVGAIEVLAAEGDWLIEGALTWQPQRAVPGALYVHEVADTDLSDRDGLRALAELGSWRTWNTADPYGDLALSTDAQWLRLRAEAAQIWGRELLANLEDARSDVMQRALGFPVHLDEIALRAHVVQRLAEHCKASDQGGDVRQAWQDCDSEVDAWRRFTEHANAALRPFHARLWVDVGDPELNIGGLYPTVFQVAVLQIFNDVAEGASYSRCANETCGRFFVRQRDGRAQHYDRTKGVRYCTRLCANQQTQRDYRRRQRAAKEGQS